MLNAVDIPIKFFNRGGFFISEGGPIVNVNVLNEKTRENVDLDKIKLNIALKVQSWLDDFISEHYEMKQDNKVVGKLNRYK